MSVMNENANWGKYGSDIVPSRFFAAYRVEGTWQGDDESTWYSFDSPDKSTIVLDPEFPNYESNKYGKSPKMSEISVTITPNATLKTTYPEAQVRIDGAWYDLGILGSPLKFFMNKDHRVNIFWSPELVETFRVVTLL